MSSSSKIDLFIPIHLYFAGDQAVNLNSPRLREACKIQGIEPHELVPKSLNDIREMYKDDHFNREALILATQHYDERREAKVKIVISERERIIEEDKETQRIHHDGMKVNRLFKLTGKVAKRTPLPETLKERQNLREMIVRQQREIDEVLFHVQNGNRVARNLYRERVLKQRSENAHYEKYADSDERIEIITGEEFRRATVGGREGSGASKENVKPTRSYIKPWKKANGRNGSDRRKQQRLVYSKEIMRFMDDEKKNKEIEKNKKVNYLSFLRRQKGNYLDHQYVWRENILTTENKRSRTVRKFYEDQLAHIEEEEERIAPPTSQTQKFSVTKHAVVESKGWLKNHKQDLQRSHSQSKAESKRKMKPAEVFLYAPNHKARPVKEYLESRSNNLDLMGTTQGSLGSVNLYNARDSSDDEDDSVRVEKNNRSQNISMSWAKSRADAPLSPQIYEDRTYAKDDEYHKMLQLRSDRTSSTLDMRATQSGFGSMRSTGMMNTFNGTWNSKTSNIFSSPRISSGVLRDTQRSFKAGDDQLRNSKDSWASKSVKFQVNKSDDDVQESIRKAKLGVQISRDDEAYQTMFEEMYRERERQEGLKNVSTDNDKKYVNKLYAVERSRANNALSQYEELKATLSRHLGPTASNF